MQVSALSETLWRKCLIPWSNWAAILQGSAYWYITTANQKLAQFIYQSFSMIFSSFCSDFLFVKEVLVIFAGLPSKFLSTLSRPNYCLMPKFSSICLAIFPQQFSQCFWPVGSIVKEVPFLFIQMVWNFYSAFMWLNNWSPENLGHFHLAIFPQQPHLHFWSVGHFRKYQLAFSFLTWDFGTMITLVDHYPPANFRPFGPVHCPQHLSNTLLFAKLCASCALLVGHGNRCLVSNNFWGSE
jgi:hypothetical protein